MKGLLNASRWVLLLVCCLSASASAADNGKDAKTNESGHPVAFSARIVDGLGRPVPEAKLTVYLLLKESGGKVRRHVLASVASAADGWARGQYDADTVAPDETVWSEAGKPGFNGYSQNSLGKEYVLKRKVGPEAIAQIVPLKGDAQRDELKLVLAGEFDSRHSLEELVFKEDRALRPALRALVTDENVGRVACQLLAFIGEPEDVAWVVKHAPAPRHKSFDDRWAYHVAAALLQPETDAEWSFLRKCAANDYDDRWVDAGGIESLKLIASERSAAELEAAEHQNQARAKSIRAALEYIKSRPAPVAGPDLKAVGELAAKATQISGWRGNSEPRYNAAGDRALIDCQFIVGRDLLKHIATFQKVDGLWKLRGIRETAQWLLAE